MNPCDRRYLDPLWRPLLEAVQAVYRGRLGSALHSVWVRGSVPRGLAVAGLSDVDTFALVESRTPFHWREPAWAKEETCRLSARFSTSSEIELVLSSYAPDLHHTNRRLSMLIATQSMPIAGPDIRAELPRFRPGPDMLLHYRWLEADLADLAGSASFRRADCRRMSKQLVRVAGELVQERDGRFTPDLYWCCEAFARFYPDRACVLRQVLHYFLNPVGEEEPFVRDFLLQTGDWLGREIKVKLPAK